MGKIFDAFGELTYRSEAEVSQNFVVPLLETFLGYQKSEIIPEKNFPVKDAYSGVQRLPNASKFFNHRPDYVVCIDGNTDKVNFIIDSKAPGEDINEHIAQLRSYSTTVGQNFLVITNGSAVQVHNANEVIFFAENISEFQIKWEHFYKLLSRAQQLRKNAIELLQELDYQAAITISPINARQTERSGKQILLADFLPYLRTLEQQFRDWHLPSEDFKGLANLDVKKLDPRELLSFTLYEPYEKDYNKSIYKLPAIQSDFSARLKIFVGVTGIGKTTLLKFLAAEAAKDCLNYLFTVIPVYIPLKRISSVNTVEKAILDNLSHNGYLCRDLALLLKNNQFIFLLDAYDEVPEECLADVDHLIELLRERNFCYLTTRVNRVPNLSQAVIFETRPLSYDQLTQISRLYLGSGSYHFMDQVENNGFTTEAGNTLILLFLLSLYKESKKLPDTISKVTTAIVQQIHHWNQQKKGRKNGEISQQVQEKILADIAYFIVVNQVAAIDLNSYEDILLAAIQTFEQKRKIPAGTTIAQVSDVLKGSGLLLINENEAYFWHRLFLNYFAAQSLAVQIGEQTANIGLPDYIPEEIVAGAASILAECTSIVSKTDHNYWLAARCISENPKCEDGLKAGVIKQLLLACKNPVEKIRDRALFYLGRIKDDRVDQFFLNCFTDNTYTNVKLAALIAIAKTGTAEARKIVDDHRGWNEWLGMFGPTTQVAVNKALAYFDETAHLDIIKSLSLHGDMFDCEACAEIFIKLGQQKKLTPDLIAGLEALYIREYHTEHKRDNIMRAIGQIFVSIDHQAFVKTVIDLLREKFCYAKLHSIQELLKGLVNIESATLLLQAIRDIDSKQSRDAIAEALANAEHFIDLPKIVALVKHHEKEVKMEGIEGLGRFDYDLVKDELAPWLDSDDTQLQSRAFGVLIKTGAIVNFIRIQDLPLMGIPTVHTLCRGIRKYNLTEAVHILDSITTQLTEDGRYLYEYHLAFDLARTYHAIGHPEGAQTIIAWYYAENAFKQTIQHLHHNMIRDALFLPRQLAIEVCSCYFRTYFNDTAERFAMIPFVETAESLQSDELRQLLIQLMERTFTGIQENSDDAKYDMERQMRAFIVLCQREDEDWLLSRIGLLRYSESGLDSPNLRRALECLDRIGTEKSLAEILSIAKQFRDCDPVLGVCFSAYESIQSRNGLPLIDAQGLFLSGLVIAG